MPRHKPITKLPPEFDARFYRRENPDLGGLADADLEAHFRGTGSTEGRVASPAASRSGFIGLLDGMEPILEIGPFSRPALAGPNVSYFDVLDTQRLRERARAHGLDPDTCPNIDFVSETADLSIVPVGFQAVFSSHVIEHQPDLIAHLAEIARVLATEACYFLAIPDKRYCFDHFLPETTIAEIVDAHVVKRRAHTAASLVRHAALTTHNDPARHWQGDHGQPGWRANPESVRAAIDRYLRSDGNYLDTHAWQFTPDGFREIAGLLYDLDMCNLRLERLYPTRRDGIEFYAILRKCRDGAIQMTASVPADFDAALYLAANPDVARAGVDPRQHFLSFGRREGRKLRP